MGRRYLRLLESALVLLLLVSRIAKTDNVVPDARSGRRRLLTMGTDGVFSAFDDSFAGLDFKLEIFLAIFALQYPGSAIHIDSAFPQTDNDYLSYFSESGRDQVVCQNLTNWLEYRIGHLRHLALAQQQLEERSAPQAL